MPISTYSISIWRHCHLWDDLIGITPISLAWEN